jgi:hypothetical protein
MRSRTVDVPAGAGAAFGLRRGVVGIGDGPTPKDARMAERFAALADGTLVSTRLEDGTFRLGRVAGPRRHDGSAEAQAVGIVHVRAADWLERPFGPDEVPPGVAATFARGGRNLQRIHGDAVERRTAELWASDSRP